MTPVVRAVARLLLPPGLVVATAIKFKVYADVGHGLNARVFVARAL